MSTYSELIVILAPYWDELPQKLKEEIENMSVQHLKEDAQKRHHSCFSCQSTNITQSEVEIICLDCGYVSEDYSSDN